MLEGITLAAVVQTLSALLAVVGGAVGVWQKIKRNEVETAYDQTQATIAALALAIETAPIDSSEKKRLKQNIQWLAEQLGTEASILKPVVRQVTEQAKAILAAREGNRLDQKGQLEAVAAWKASRSSAAVPLKGIAPLLFVAMMALGATSCAVNDPRGLVQVVVVPPDANDETPALVEVAWPAGISENPADFVTIKTSAGVMVTTAPLIGSMPEEPARP